MICSARKSPSRRDSPAKWTQQHRHRHEVRTWRETSGELELLPKQGAAEPWTRRACETHGVAGATKSDAICGKGRPVTDRWQTRLGLRAIGARSTPRSTRDAAFLILSHDGSTRAPVGPGQADKRVYPFGDNTDPRTGFQTHGSCCLSTPSATGSGHGRESSRQCASAE